MILVTSVKQLITGSAGRICLALFDYYRNAKRPSGYPDGLEKRIDLVLFDYCYNLAYVLSLTKAITNSLCFFNVLSSSISGIDIHT